MTPASVGVVAAAWGVLVASAWGLLVASACGASCIDLSVVSHDSKINAASHPVLGPLTWSVLCVTSSGMEAMHTQSRPIGVMLPHAISCQ